MTKLLFIQPSLTHVGGVEKVLPLVAQGLQAKGFKTSGLSFYDPKTYQPDFFDEFKTLAEAPTKNWFDKFFKIINRLLWIKRVCREMKPDGIIVSTPGASLTVLLFKKLWGSRVPVFVYVHQALSASDRGYVVLTKWLFGEAAGFIAVSAGVASEVKNVTKSPVVVAYNPVKENQHTHSIIKKVNQVPIFITASRLESIRGVDILVGLMIDYLQKNSGELWLFGEGSLENQLMEVVRNSGLQDRLLFKGVVPDMSVYLSQADVYLSCARSEALGMSLLETLQAGVPIVCTDVPYGPREVMKVKLAEKINYPYQTPYGILFGTINKNDSTKTSVQNLQINFFAALEIAILQRNENVAIRIERSADFSSESAVLVITDLVRSQIKS